MTAVVCSEMAMVKQWCSAAGQSAIYCKQEGSPRPSLADPGHGIDWLLPVRLHFDASLREAFGAITCCTYMHVIHQ